MAYAVQLQDLQNRCLQRVDQLTAQFIPTLNLISMINVGIGKLYAKVVEKFEDYYLIAGTPFALSSNNDTYPIPQDLYKLRGVEFQLDSLHWVSVPSYEWPERNDYNYFPVSAYVSPAGTSVRYRYQGLGVRFIPMPSVGGITARYWYIPSWNPILVNPTDTFDFINPGWEEYVVLDVAATILQIEESDCSVVLQLRSEMDHQIEVWASDRDAGAPKKMTSSRYRDRWRGGWPGFM